MLVENKVAVKSTKNVNLSELELYSFLEEWDMLYQDQVRKLDLFNFDKVKLWSQSQKEFFVRVFYHLRGNFSDFLWYMGSFSPDKETKQLILRNIEDEFSLNGFSHEQLYFRFASFFGVDLTYELLEKKFYLPFAKEYINGQLRWLRDNDSDSRLTAFAAIERLDNLDYLNFKNIAIALGVEDKYLTFFNVHITADHFEDILSSKFLALWEKDSCLVKEVFSFVSKFQISMLLKFSESIYMID